MTTRRNLPNAFDAIKESLQARAVLDVLDHENTTNDHILATWLGAIGLGAARRQLSELLDRLERDDLVRTEMVENFRVIHMRQLGRDVASGREAVEWIARKELRD